MSLADLLYHTGIGLLNLWAVFWNLTLILLILTNKKLRSDGQKTLVINVAVCLIVSALLSIFDQTRSLSPEVQSWFETKGPCEGIVTANLACDILVPYSLFLVVVDLCVQLKDPPFYAPSVGRSACMALCDWLLSAALTFLLLFGVGRVARASDRPECFIQHSMLYDITERSISFFSPSVLLLVAILILICLSCRGRRLTTLELHRGNPDIAVIRHAKKSALPVAIVTICFLIMWAPYNSLYFIHVIFKKNEFTFYMKICRHVAKATSAILPLLWMSVDPGIRHACCNCCVPPSDTEE